MQVARGGTPFWLEASRPLIEPMLRAMKLANTMLDALYYDVQVVAWELFWRGAIVVGGREDLVSASLAEMTRAFSTLDLGALSNPEGSIIVVDAGRPPYIVRFEKVADFLNWADAAAVRAVSITGAGSSAFGSVSFAWNVSVALGEPVAAIVPGYGLADVAHQICETCFGYGKHTDWIGSFVQSVLALVAPQFAAIGHKALAQLPERAWAFPGAFLFRYSGDAPEVLHHILENARGRGIAFLFGHSKGALAVSHALADLAPEKMEPLRIITFGCPIAEDRKAAGYHQFLGVFDGLGWLNSWGHLPDMVIFSHHSTNTALLLSMPVTLLTRIALAQDRRFASLPTLPAIADRTVPATSSPVLVPGPWPRKS
ncbi:hypothetical protein [Beijerinckia mobilis]|uniref:hypothetical protein n=1 Tax=Beijerinckia mobilis TaxID=231434 RepID=UPI00054F63CD|nr:hypothetical protein [Beijerinckia mobilis]